VAWTDILQIWTCDGLFPVSLMSSRANSIVLCLEISICTAQVEDLDVVCKRR